MYYENELYHHGRQDQRWGIRNGPPYPLSRATIREAYGRRKNKKALKALQKEQQKREQNDQTRESDETKENNKKTKTFENNDQLIREGSIEDFLRYRTQLSTKEVQDALNRSKNLRELYTILDDYNKQELIRSGNVNAILRNKANLSTNQLNDVLNRLDYTKRLGEYSKAEDEKNWKAMKDTMEKVGDVKNWIKTGTELWKNIEEAMQLMDKYKKS